MENASNTERTRACARDTIAAVSTPYGRGGIAVIRISGEEAMKVAGRVFLTSGGLRPGDVPSKSARHGTIFYNGEEIDDGVVTVYRAPGSFTGEDTVEISCHGGILLTAKVLESVLCAGARQAQPGEFSQRAFLSGKLTLSRAEAIIDGIDAENMHQLRLAAGNAHGALERRIDGIRRRLTDLLADVYVTIDYPDEGLEDLSRGELEAGLFEARSELERLYETRRAGQAIAHGVPTAIVGRPNTGKSSLLNLLLGRERAIVTEYAGTTRDTVEESALLGRITLRLCDTAGIRRTDDPVERIGVQKSYEKMEEAELIFAVFDGSEPASDEDLSLIGRLKTCGKPVIALLNKSDKERKFDGKLLDAFPVVPICAKEKEPPEELKEKVERIYIGEGLFSLDEGALTNARQAAGAKGALEGVDRALDALGRGTPPDVAFSDVEDALTKLGQIDGREVGEEIASSIFRRFCVGK